MVAVAGDHDDRRGLDEVAQLLQHLEAVHAGHLDVEEDQVGRFALDQRDALFAGRRLHDFVAFVLEDHLQRVADRGFVVDDQDAWFHRISVRTRADARADRARGRRDRRASDVAGPRRADEAAEAGDRVAPAGG